MNTRVRPIAVIVKAVCLFIVINLVYGLMEPPIAEISAYNVFVPGLERTPFGNNDDPYTVVIDNADAMFASHEISAEKQPDEIRVALIGDSSIWGESLLLNNTLSGQWNQLGSQCNGKKIRVYNLGYPHPSIIKDLIFMDEVMSRQPDVIIWFVTLNTLMNQYRLHPFLAGNHERVLKIVEKYDISFGPRKVLSEQETGFYEKTLVGQRSLLARLLKLQALSLIWSATGVDFHVEPGLTSALASDVDTDIAYRSLEPGTDLRESLLLDAIDAGFDIAGETPILLVNEPIFIANGLHSDVRYNDFYPRWAYDQYRDLLLKQTQKFPFNYLDMWNAIPSENFIDTPLHLNAEGERLLAERVNPTLLSMVCP